MDEEKLIILVQGNECLYNLQHNDYDNNLLRDNSWKEISELHAQDKELSRRTQHCRRMAESWQGNGMVCVNRPLKAMLKQILLQLCDVITSGFVQHAIKRPISQLLDIIMRVKHMGIQG
jgi:hypothetical protein